MRIKLEVCIGQRCAAGLIPVLLISDADILGSAFAHRNIAVHRTVLTIHGEEEFSSVILALHVPDREKDQFTDTQRVVGLILEIGDVVRIGVSVHDHLTRPLLDTLHEFLHAGDRIFCDRKDRSIEEDLLCKKDHLALVIGLQHVHDIALEDAGSIKRNALPGKHTTGHMFGRLVARILRRTLTVRLETRERRAERGELFRNTFGTIDAEECLALIGLISQHSCQFRMCEDLIGKQPDRHINLVQEFLVLIGSQLTTDGRVISDIIQEHLLSLLSGMRKRDSTSRHSTDHAAFISKRGRGTDRASDIGIAGLCNKIAATLFTMETVIYFLIPGVADIIAAFEFCYFVFTRKNRVTETTRVLLGFIVYKICQTIRTVKCYFHRCTALLLHSII